MPALRACSGHRTCHVLSGGSPIEDRMCSEKVVPLRHYMSYQSPSERTAFGMRFVS